jgi:NAD(P)-dependent dehydrogenase (short-subunit alcohol dehydrogenase family)
LSRAGGAAGDGIGNGRAAAILLACAGTKVLVVDRDLALAERTVAMIAANELVGGVGQVLVQELQPLAPRELVPLVDIDAGAPGGDGREPDDRPLVRRIPRGLVVSQVLSTGDRDRAENACPFAIGCTR